MDTSLLHRLVQILAAVSWALLISSCQTASNGPSGLQEIDKQVDAVTQYHLGLQHQSKDEAENNKIAARHYRKSAEQGYALAQYRLGTMYFLGQGVELDYEEALKWYEKAAEQGYARAQGGIGDKYFLGKGVVLDYKKAFKWYKKAAEQGSADAQRHLGGMYLEGKGVTQDYKEALMWYQRAAEQGVAIAHLNVGYLAEALPDPATTKMKGNNPFHRVCTGNYRIIYQILEDRLVILGVKVGHRKDVYKRLL